MVGAGGDDLAAEFGDQPDRGHVVDVGEHRQLGREICVDGREVPQVPGAVAHPLVHGTGWPRPSVGGGRAQVHGPAVGQQDVGLPVLAGTPGLGHGTGGVAPGSVTPDQSRGSNGSRPCSG